MIDFSHCKINPYKTFGGANDSKIGIIYQKMLANRKGKIIDFSFQKAINQKNNRLSD